jgi:hypothetical protein
MMKVSRAGNKEFLEKMKDNEYRKEFSKKMSEINKKSFELGTRERKYFYDWTGKTRWYQFSALVPFCALPVCWPQYCRR